MPRIHRITNSALLAVLACLLASLTGTKAAFAERLVHAHFVVYPLAGNWVPDVRMTFGGSGVPHQSKLVEEPHRARRVAVPISSFVPEAWGRDGFVLDFNTESSGMLNVRLVSANFAYDGVDGSNTRPAQFYFMRVPSEIVGRSRLVPEIEAHCDRIARNLSDRELLQMYFKCRDLYENASKHLQRPDTRVLKAFKGWFDASYNLWKESNGIYMFDEGLFAEYEDHIGPVLQLNSVFSDAGFQVALRDVHATEVGLIYNEAAELRKWNFNDEAIALLCEARERYLQLGLHPDEPPRISLDGHINKRIAEYGGNVNECAAMVSLNFH